ncbi:hypothetical protein [Lysobacter sp. CA199]|uniref:hypothetical protein n=1 Tax=Lysobacter sp. CA199 TaxID=3455608 RepID=UPI003F8D88F6
MILALIGSLAACAGAGTHRQASVWHGRTEGVVEADLRHAAARLPEQGWLARTTRERADGYLDYSRLDGQGYSDRGWYVVRKRQKVGEDYYGLLQINDGTAELCTLNPQRRGFLDGDTFVTTVSWDYCTPLSQR